MVALRLDEVLVTMIVEKLKQKMPNRVGAINAEKNDGVLLSTPTDSNYFTSGVQSMPETPAIIVTPGRTDFEAGAEGPHSFVSQTDIVVYIFEQDADRQQLGTRLMRQARAVIESLWDEDPIQRLDSRAYNLIPSRTIPGTVFEPTADDSWRGFYIVVFAVWNLEG